MPQDHFYLIYSNVMMIYFVLDKLSSSSLEWKRLSSIELREIILF